jgi:hypothetical protein
LEIVKIHTDAGFEDIPRPEVIQNFWILIEFLQSNHLTKRLVAASLEEMSDETRLCNFDLTDDGYYFLQKYLGRYHGRLYKRDTVQKSKQFLTKWLNEFKTKAPR